MDNDENGLTTLAAPLAQLLAARRRNTFGLARTLADAALESSPDAIIACDRSGLIHYRNPAAEWILTRGFPLERCRGQILAGSGGERAALAKAVIAAIDKGLTSRLSVDSTALGRYVIRIDAEPADSPYAVIIVRNIDAHAVRVIQDTAGAHGFTTAEAALAQSLVRGLSVEAHAEEKGLAVSTVRTQLRALLAKTGTSRQGQMISILLSDPPIISRRLPMEVPDDC
jgi:DNA-binding CsgD family transcriptional regulator